MTDTARILGEAIREYEQWAAHRIYDTSVESFLQEKEWRAKAELYDEHMESCGKSQRPNVPVRFELVEGTD